MNTDVQICIRLGAIMTSAEGIKQLLSFSANTYVASFSIHRWHVSCSKDPMISLVLKQRLFVLSRELQTEMIRKSIHISIALVPSVVALFGTGITLIMLAFGTVFYCVAEYGRHRGIATPIVSRITELASRRRELNTFVLGPVTLGLGAMLALLLYPNPAATVAIYALAFGDALAALVGKLIGTLRIPGTGGKTAEGSIACVFAVTLAAFIVVQDLRIAIVAGVSAALLEMLPSNDADNLILPAGTGLIVTSML